MLAMLCCSPSRSMSSSVVAPLPLPFPIPRPCPCRCGITNADEAAAAVTEDAVEGRDADDWRAWLLLLKRDCCCC